MTKIPYVCLYRSYREELALYTDEEVGRLVRALLDYLNDGTQTPLPERESLFWNRLRSQHDRDAEHYDAICEKNRINGKKGGRKRSEENPTQPTAFGYGNYSLPKAMGAKENEKENENDKENEKECVCSTHEHTLFIPPSLIDVVSFASSEGLTHMDPQKFVDYYTAVGWVSGGRPIRDWKAMARLWNRRSEKEAPKVVEEVIYGDVL